MPNTERVEPFLTLKTRRYSIDGGRVTLLEVECPELSFGMGVDVRKRSDYRLIDDFMEAIRGGVARLSAIDFIRPEANPEELRIAKRIHESTSQGTPLARLFKHP